MFSESWTDTLSADCEDSLIFSLGLLLSFSVWVPFFTAMFWLHNYPRVLAVVLQVSLPTLRFCFCLLIPSSDPSHSFLTQRRYREICAWQDKLELFFLVVGDSWKKFKLFKGLPICAGRRELRGHWQEDRRMLSATCFSFPDLSACWGGKAGLGGRLRESGWT